MSCYILPAASTFVNVAAIYQPVVLGSPLWSVDGHQHSPNTDSLSSSLGPLPFDSSALLVLPGDSAAASPPSVRLEATSVGGLCTSALAGDVTSLYHAHHQLQKQIDFRSAVTTCFRVAAKSSGPDFYRLRRLLRRAKRRQAAGDEDAGDDDSGGGSIGRYPLYCIVCRVRLNAQLQAKQHYNGRSHARRVRLLYGAPAITAGTASDPAFSSTTSTSHDAEVSSTTSTGSEVTSSSSSSSVCGDVTSPRFPAGSREPVSCDVYCSACAVSFNSTTQARQHYLGKTHAKRLRTTFNDHPPRRHPVSRTFQKDASHSCSVCSAKPDDAVLNKHDFSNARPHGYVKHSNRLSSGRRHAKLPLAR